MKSLMLSSFRLCSLGISRRFRPSGSGSWKLRGNSGRIATSGLRERKRCAACDARTTVGIPVAALFPVKERIRAHVRNILHKRRVAAKEASENAAR